MSTDTSILEARETALNWPSKVLETREFPRRSRAAFYSSGLDASTGGTVSEPT